MSFEGRYAAASGRGELVEKTLLAVGLLAFFGGGYFGIGYFTAPAHAHDLALPLDLALRFDAIWVWAYIWVIPAAVAPLFLIRSQSLYRRTFLAYAITIAISCFVFLIYPVSAAGLRAQAPLDIMRFSDRMVAVLYRVDPSVNAFPSLHLALVTLAALAAWKASRMMGLILGLSVPTVAIAVLLVKQHFILDAITGVALALLVGLPLIGGYKPAASETAGYSWRGPAVFTAFVGFCYAIIILIGTSWTL